MLAETMVAWR